MAETECLVNNYGFNLAEALDGFKGKYEYLKDKAGQEPSLVDLANVTEKMIKKAVTKVQLRHPNLRVRIEEDAERIPWFTSEGVREIPVEVIAKIISSANYKGICSRMNTYNYFIS
ncbi:MAG: hypothetical protein ACFFD4_36385 [Candidatus Odinarchaeota archaeon]